MAYNEDLAIKISSKMENELEKHNVRPMKEFVFIEVENYKDIPYWIDLGVEHA